MVRQASCIIYFFKFFLEILTWRHFSWHSIGHDCSQSKQNKTKQKNGIFSNLLGNNCGTHTSSRAPSVERQSYCLNHYPSSVQLYVILTLNKFWARELTWLKKWLHISHKLEFCYHEIEITSHEIIRSFPIKRYLKWRKF